MEVLDKLIALIKELIPLLLAMGIPVGSVWGLVARKRRKDAAQGPVDTPVLQGTPVPAASSDEFQNRTLEYFIAHAAALEKELDKAHDALRAAGIPIP